MIKEKAFKKNEKKNEKKKEEYKRVYKEGNGNKFYGKEKEVLGYKKKIRELENEKKNYLNDLEKKENEIKRDMMKKFRFSSVENLKKNLYLFDKKIENLKNEEEKKKKIEIIDGLKNKDLKEFFNNTKKNFGDRGDCVLKYRNNFLDVLKIRFG